MAYTEEGIREFAYVDMGQFPHDSNLTAEVILRSLLHLRGNMKNKLLIQMDNCCRENKNKYILALAHVLVDLDIFEEVSMIEEMLHNLLL